MDHLLAGDWLLAGDLLNRAGIATRLFELALALVGRIRGSLAHADIVASMIFAGMSGVAQADAAGLGTLGIDPVHFGLILIFNLLIGATTPPCWVIIMMEIAKISFGRMTRAMLPFYLPLGRALPIITYWPGLVLWLPRLVERF
jgi:TRAP-type C4-dicarboxylate transport system permease large subunit